MILFLLFWGLFMSVGYVNLIRSVFCRYKLKNRLVRVAPSINKTKKFVCFIVVLIIALAVYIYKYVFYPEENIFRARISLYTFIILGSFLVYVVPLAINLGYTYISDNMIMFPDRVQKSSDYRYRINENILVLCHAKQPDRPESYVISENRELLEEILTKNYQMIDEQ